MIVPDSRIILCGGALILTLLSGVWVSRLGRPVNIVVFTIHKLVALAAVVLISLTIYPLFSAASTPPFLISGVVILAGLLFLALFVTGALLSFERPTPRFILRIHQIAPLLALAAAASAVYLLEASQP